MSEFYKMEPLRWDRGTDNLTLEQEAAYLRICNAIYAADQPIRPNVRVLAGMWRCNERKAKRLLAELMDTGKVKISDGWIVNEKAVDDVSKRRALRVKRQLAGHAGGIESGKSRAKPLQSNDKAEANASTRKEVETEVEVEKKDHAPQGAARFLEFWISYPHRDGVKRARAKVEAKYRAHVKSGVPEQSFIDAVARLKADKRVKDGFARDPLTWINQRGWEDEAPAVPTDTARLDAFRNRLRAGQPLYPDMMTADDTEALIASGDLTREEAARCAYPLAADPIRRTA